MYKLQKITLLFFLSLSLQALQGQHASSQLVILLETDQANEAEVKMFPADTQVMIDGLDGEYATIISRADGPDEYQGTFLITLVLAEDNRALQLPVVQGRALFFADTKAATYYQDARNSGQ